MFDKLELDDNLVRACRELGFKNPTSIQEMVLPPAMEGKDILASAPTGTGKTAAFLLPALQFMLDFPRREPGSCRVLILTPTRELALQIYEQAQALSRFTHFNCGVITGGINYGTDKDTLSQNLDILVATPGRLFEHIENETFDCRDIEILVLDEADRMLDMGFSSIVNQIAAEARWRKQTFLFSATLEGPGIARFARDILKDPVQVEANPSRREQGKIMQWMHLCDDAAHKFALLEHILKNQVQTAIVFVKTRDRLMQLKQQLDSAQIPCCWLQGEMPQDKRIDALVRFKSGAVKVLIATDVAARGIDIPDVSHVINYDLPRTADVYVHRIGRTGRAGKKGIAISLVEAHDYKMLGRIERYSGELIKKRVIDELRPKHKAPSLAKKKKKAAAKKGKSTVKKSATKRASKSA
ncbi:ATP-dependent RNA helicase SrmB [Aliiglaciecola sp. CAU 1673]|uniref:ATP-dependent RNA helicase SrmB n=1 Tax=Aliiglaciecola sp. CAU 1673 TaxID=3032595 RepID=UPI0023DBAEF9|nr:ATP-dependent RNA helicase SrmB [Aliiglaciecola sp. CAU 1673]MDF2177455.1 ATP-dependent RNA helicase SrmB [Aliiglaciecola sp. CAU 1673]